MKISILVVLMILSVDNESINHDCAFFYKDQLSGLLIDSEVRKKEETTDFFLIFYNEGEKVLKILKNEIGLKIFSDIQIGDQLLKNNKDFIGFAIVKYDSNNQIEKINSYKYLCSF